MLSGAMNLVCYIYHAHFRDLEKLHEGSVSEELIESVGLLL